MVLAMLMSIVPRRNGNGWKLSKLHDMLHGCQCIDRFGSMMNWDTSASERNHKWNTKAPATTAQKRHDSIFLPQVGKHIDDMAVIEKARRRSGMPSLLPVWSEVPDGNDSNTANKTGFVETNPAFVVHLDAEVNMFRLDWVRKGGVGNHLIHPLVFDYLKSKIKDSVPGKPGHYKSIQAYTEYQKDGVLFRAHPSYQSNKPWYDWCKVLLPSFVG